MVSDVSLLKKIGLSDKEIAVYLKLLEYGAISVRSLAEVAGINRGTTYDILKKLQEIGLVSYYHTETKQRFVAENPDKLLKVIEDKESEIDATKKKIIKFIPQLKAMQDKGGLSPVSKFYEGDNGIRQVLEDVLEIVGAKKEKEYFIYSATNASDDINKAFPNFTKQRIKKGIKVKAISLAKGGKTYGLDERRWLGSNEESATFVIIYFGKCAYISRDLSNNPVGVIIENKNIYDTQKIIFNKLWQALK